MTPKTPVSWASADVILFVTIRLAVPSIEQLMCEQLYAIKVSQYKTIEFFEAGSSLKLLENRMSTPKLQILLDLAGSQALNEAINLLVEVSQSCLRVCIWRR